MEITFEQIKHRKDYLSVDRQTAISAQGEIFEVGDAVCHQSEEAEEALITSFSLDEETMDVKAHTSLGWARICFLYKPDRTL